MISKIQSLSKSSAILPILIMKIRAFSLVIKFLFTLFIARYMGFEELGIYGLITAVSVMAPSILGLSFMYTMSRKAITQTQEEIVQELHYYGRFMFGLYAALLVGSSVYGVVTNQPKLAVLILAVLFLEHVNIDLYSLMLNLSKQVSANILHFVRSALWMCIVMVLAFVFPQILSLEFILLGWILGGLISLVGFFFVMRDWSWERHSGALSTYKWIKQEFKEARAICGSNAITTLAQYLNHFLITIFLGVGLTGVYVFFMQAFSAMANLLQTGVVQVARPKLVKAYKERSENFETLYNKCLIHTVLIALVMSVCAWLGMYVLVHYALDNPLALTWFPIFSLVLLVFIGTMVIKVNKLVIYAQHLDGFILKVTLVTTPTSAGLSVLMIHFGGLWGAMISSLIMVCILLFIYHFQTRRAFAAYRLSVKK